MELLTVRQVAEILQINPMTVRRYIEAGKLAAVRVGRRVRVRREALEDLMEPVFAKRKKSEPTIPGRPTSTDDPLWQLVGIGESREPTDASRKHEYLAGAN
jgi:excisionase family DNA binding protein